MELVSHACRIHFPYLQNSFTIHVYGISFTYMRNSFPTLAEFIYHTHGISFTHMQNSFLVHEKFISHTCRIRYSELEHTSSSYSCISQCKPSDPFNHDCSEASLLVAEKNPSRYRIIGFTVCLRQEFVCKNLGQGGGGRG